MQKKKETAHYFSVIQKKEGEKRENNETIACYQAGLAKRAICLIGNTVRVEMSGVERL